MTFDQIVQKVMDRTNLTSSDARTRIGDEVNEVFRDVVSSMGMETSVRSVTEALSVTDSRYVTFGGSGEDDDRVIKLLAVFIPSSVAPPPYNVLNSVTFDELRNTIPGSWPPSQYAISKVSAATVEVFLDATAPDNTQVLQADCMLASDTMDGDDEPFFTENFHDILVYGTMYIELDKMEKEDRATRALNRFDDRLAQLRMFYAKDAYIAIHQGKTNRQWAGGLLVS